MEKHTVFMLKKLKVSVLPQIVHKFNMIAIKNPSKIFLYIQKRLFQIVDGKAKELHTAGKGILKKKNNVGGISLADFKTYDKTTQIKTVILSEG